VFVCTGVILGYVLYLCITLCTGELLQNFLYLLLTYFPEQEENLRKHPRLLPYMPGEATDDDDDHSADGDSVVSDNLSESSATLGVTTALRSESTADAPAAAGASKKVKTVSLQDKAALEGVFANMGTMSFSGPSQPKPLPRPKSMKVSRSQRHSDARSERSQSDAVRMSTDAPTGISPVAQAASGQSAGNAGK
jgi:hypothetical protein